MFGRPRSTNFGFVLSKLPLSPERISSYGALNMSAAARPDSACDRAQFLAVADEEIGVVLTKMRSAVSPLSSHSLGDARRCLVWENLRAANR
jgi:hypothetical protein